MRKLLTMILCSLMLLAASSSVKAQEISITLWPGWTWISYPRADTLSFSTAMGSFTPMQGDIIKSQWGNAIYMGDGQWRGSISHFYPGYGYMYKSNRMIPTPLTITNAHCPEVNTLAPSNITTTTANVGGNITNSNGATITQCGVYWSTEPHPTINDNIIIAENVTIGEFTIELVGLVPSTIYYFRAFAMNSIGMAYGEEMSFTTVPPTIPEGAINGVFSVSDNQQIYFSQGNLQYIGSAVTPYWKFADNQWDYLGDNGQGSTNQTIDRDLFGWGTSGYHHRDYSYQPWSTSTNYTEYYAYGMYSYNLYDQTGMADWGYNAISNGGNVENNGWRTLTTDEWNYLLLSRSTTSGIRFAKGKVNNVNGVILLPDNWVTTTYMLNNTNSIETDFNCNTISIEEWISVFEANGAVFLPTASRRNGTVVYGTNNGYYWSSSFCYSGYANYLYFGANHIGPQNYDDISEGLSVRLVRPAENMTYYNINVTPNPAEGGTLTGEGNYAEGQTCTLIATANNGYTFANWMENDEVVSTEATYTFTVTGNRSLTAIFYVTLGEENVVNGDFEQGNVGFTSAFEYNSNLFDAGTYYVDNNASLHHPNFGGHGHGGTGNFMIVNGATIPETNVWTEQLTVTSNTYYTFSTWVCTVAGGSPAVLQFSINGNQIGEVFSAPSQTNTWQHFYVLWYSGNSTTATITILNQNTEGIGNDFGLDDISFREINPVQGGIPEGAINGKFTINENGDQVYFSQGNLQYQASTNTWKFAGNQYDYIGDANSNISSTYDGWIDLFGWGTSGYNHGAICYQPWSTSTEYSDYYAYGNYQYNLYDQTGQADWGYNPISNGGNTANQWRTLTQPEWDYVFNTRATTSGIRYAKANVNNVNGVILLPDDWSNNTYSLSNTNINASFSSNTISSSQWTTLEDAGAIFLPAAGYRGGTSVSCVGSDGRYWSASYYIIYTASLIDFNDSYFGTNDFNSVTRCYGLCVRLVAPFEN